jgi:hypothetical protein
MIAAVLWQKTKKMLGSVDAKEVADYFINA